MQADPVVRVLGALERERVRYAVFGAVAVNVHGLPRFTEDLDIFVAPERENIEALKRALHSVFADPSIDEITADDLLGDYPAIQYVPPEGTSTSTSSRGWARRSVSRTSKPNGCLSRGCW